MTTKEMATLARERLAALPHDDGVVALYVLDEGPNEHLRNALALLTVLRETHPGSARFIPELTTAIRRGETAVLFLEARSIIVPFPVSLLALELTIEALVEVPLDWKAVPEMQAAAWRLFRAREQMQRELVA